MYEPRASVIHLEGSTAGVDGSAGHKRYQELNRPKFVEKWRDRLEAEHMPNDLSRAWAASNRRRQLRVLVVDHRMPMWDRDAGSLRMRAILEILVDLGCQVSFLPDNLSAGQPYTRELQEAGVEVLYGLDVQAIWSSWPDGFSLIILSRPPVAGRWLEIFREHAPRDRALRHRGSALAA